VCAYIRISNALGHMPLQEHIITYANFCLMLERKLSDRDAGYKLATEKWFAAFLNRTGIKMRKQEHYDKGRYNVRAVSIRDFRDKLRILGV